MNNVKRSISIMWVWIFRSLLFFLPDHPWIMRFRGFIYSMLMPSCGRNFQIAHSANIVAASTIKVGKNVYVANNVTIIGGDIQIGNDVIIGPGAVIVSSEHVFSKLQKSYRFAPSTVKKVILGDGCWIAANSTVVAGACLPSFSILAANSVLITQEHISGLYAGVPAIVKKTYDQSSDRSLEKGIHQLGIL